MPSAASFIGNATATGGTDTNTPGIILGYDGGTLVFGAITITITLTKVPVTGFIAGDFTVSNCVMSNLAQVGNTNIYTVTCTPTADGPFSLSVSSSKFTDSGGRNNTASNTLNLTYIKDTATHNIQLATITKSQHYRGHIATFSENTDGGTTASGEMLCFKYNSGAQSFFLSFNPQSIDVSDAKRVSLGNYVNCTSGNAPLGTFPTVDANITADRGGVPPSVLGYAGGVTYCQLNFKPYMLMGRNALSEFDGHNEYRYSGLTDNDMINRALTFRLDKYTPGTNTLGEVTPNWAGAKSYLDNNIATIIAAAGWYTSFRHWVYDYQDYAPVYLDYLYNTLLAGQDVARIPIDIAAEYYWAREAVDSISGNVRTVTITHSKKYPSSPYSRITTPVWIRLDLSATNYAGTGIAAFSGSNVCKVRSMGGDVYYVGVLLNYDNPSTSFDVVNTSTPSYVNLTVPVPSLSGSTLTTDQAVRIALFGLSISNVGSSSTSVAIPTSHPTTVSVTVNTGLTIPDGSMVKLYKDSTHYICGKSTSYNSGTGALTFSSLGNVGTGTFNSWTLYVGGYEISASLLERQNTQSTSHVLTTSLTPTSKYFELGYINDEMISAVLHF